jgi:hypothetical protein
MDNTSKLKSLIRNEHPFLSQDPLVDEVVNYCSQSIKLSGRLFNFLTNFLFLLIDVFSLLFYRKRFSRIDSLQQTNAWNRLRSLPGFSQFGDFLRTLSLLRLVELSGNKHEKI